MNDEWVIKTSSRITITDFHSYLSVKFASITHCNDIWYEYAFNGANNNETQTNVKSSPTSIKIQIIQNRDIFFKPTKWTNLSNTNDAKSFQPLSRGHCAFSSIYMYRHISFGFLRTWSFLLWFCRLQNDIQYYKAKTKQIVKSEVLKR